MPEKNRGWDVDDGQSGQLSTRSQSRCCRRWGESVISVRLMRRQPDKHRRHPEPGRDHRQRHSTRSLAKFAQNQRADRLVLGEVCLGSHSPTTAVTRTRLSEESIVGAPSACLNVCAEAKERDVQKKFMAWHLHSGHTPQNQCQSGRFCSGPAAGVAS